ncbi:sodium:solute symporter family transporter [Chitinophaga qingshengii]|uniref:Sodium/solute symporter n=1 Tax=Chitinophaga qingshengii TaxID=1569794 RepID=A0ABR7TJC8_9BACT|nr:sodium/solute symporter [Chitinophaga qingshengii]
MKITLAGIDYLVLFIYVVALFIFGFYLKSRRAASGTDIFLGGRSLNWWQIGFSMFSANAGPMMLIGLSSLGFSKGVVGANFEWLAWVFLMLLAAFFIPRYIATGISTIPQFLLWRYGRRSYNFLVIYSLFSILFVWLGSALYAGGLVISGIFRCSLLEAVLLVAVIATSYTAMGGLKAVVRTGVFQSLIIIVSSCLLTVLALGKTISTHVWNTPVPADFWKLLHTDRDPEYSWMAIFAGYPVVAVYYWCADQTIVQKVLAARNVRQGQYGILLLAGLKIITPFIFIFPGILCWLLYGNSTTPDNAYVTLVNNLMPPGLRGLCIAALIAALIDTVSAGLNSFSTVFTLDVIGQLRPLQEGDSIRIGRWLTVVAALLSVGIAILFSYSGKSLFELTQGLVSILAPPLSVVFLSGIFWPRTDRLGAELVLFGGGFVCLVVGFCYVLNYPYKGYWPHFLLLSVYLFIGLAAVMASVTVARRQPATGALPSVSGISSNLAMSRGLWLGWGILAVIMVIIYIVLN